jgi:NitT/TauT family transport system ATP-binding protein
MVTDGSRYGEVVLRGVAKHFGEKAVQVKILEDLSFVVERGRLNVLIGPSGCGKTTTINLIAGYERPSRGEVLMDGSPVTGPGWDRLVVFQETALFPWMTTLENVRFGPAVRGTMSKRETDQEARRLLEKVGLRGFEDKFPIQLSGGMQRRAELARAMINDPKIMLMDEPFRGLDAMTRELMQEYYLRLFEESGRTNLFVTSELEEAIFIADRLIVLTGKPTRVKKVMVVDLPRPRKVQMLTSRRYGDLRQEALEALYEEAVKAFAGGSKAAYDLVEAFSRRGARE